MMKNKTRDMTPFDMGKAPVRQYPFLLPLIWGGSWIMTRQFQLKITRQLRGVRPPWLVIATHQGFSDYYIAPLALFPHRANYVSDMEGFAAFGEWLYRGIGCIGKRRYVSEPAVLLNMKRALAHRQSVVVFPESRHSNVGTTSYIPHNMGKLAKWAKVPVVALSVHGSYLANPFWDEEHTRKVPMEAKIECLYTAQEAAQETEEKIQRRIEDALKYDEYAWQWERKIPIRYSRRAQGLHKALYQCMACGSRYEMYSEGFRLCCNTCGTVWEMDEYGRLWQGRHSFHIPDWYEWEREQTHRELQTGIAGEEYNVKVEALPNAKGFVPLGEGTLCWNRKGFLLKLSDRELFFSHALRESVQTEYDYKGRGPCIVLSERDCCYYIYSQERHFCPTRLQFVGEYFYQRARSIK